MTTLTGLNAAAVAPTTVATQQRSPWHSPVPYLFGGLAAMLGLIAFALFILACSYWKLSGRIDGTGNGDQNGDIEGGDNNNNKDAEGDALKSVKVYEEKILVIMAGHENPTFLATPVSAKPSADHGNIIRTSTHEEAEDNSETEEKAKAVTTNHHHHEEEETQIDQQQNP